MSNALEWCMTKQLKQQQ